MERQFNGPGDWDLVREAYADRVEDLLAEYLPNIKTAKVERYVRTPLDYMRSNQSRITGGVNGGAMISNQIGMNRPFPGCGAPRTPIRKLYTTDVAQRLSGMLGGYIAARTVGEDLGVLRDQAWWGKTRAMEPYLKMCQRIDRKRRLQF